MHVAELFNNREQALLIWGSIVFLLLFSQKEARKTLAEIIAILLGRTILPILVSMALYVGLQVAAVRMIIDWNLSLTKDTFIWAIFTAFVLVLHVYRDAKDPTHFRNVALRSLGLVILVEFLLDSFPFDLIGELIFVPFITFISMLRVVSTSNERFKSLRQLCDFVLAAVGGILTLQVISSMLRDFQGLMTTESLYSLLLAPVLTITFIPYLYILAVVMVYQNCFNMFRLYLPGYPELVPIAQRRTVVACRFNLGKIRRFEAELPTMIKRSPTKDRAAVINAVRELSMRKIADSGLS